MPKKTKKDKLLTLEEAMQQIPYADKNAGGKILIDPDSPTGVRHQRPHNPHPSIRLPYHSSKGEVISSTNEICYGFQNITDNEKSIIFFYAEYLKRKYYLDCNCAYNSGEISKKKIDYVKFGRSKKYKFIYQESSDERYDRLWKIFGLKKSLLHSEREKNYEIDRKEKNDNRNLYKILIEKYYKFYDIIQRLISDEEVENDLQGSEFAYEPDMTREQKQILDKYFQNNKYTEYTYEKILYNLSYLGINCLEDIAQNNKSQKKSVSEEITSNIDPNFLDVCKTLRSLLSSKMDYEFLYIYKSIINKYFLYFYDLINMSSIDKIIKNDYQIKSMPNFLIIPNINLSLPKFYSDKIRPMLNLNKGIFNISCDLSENFDSNVIIEAIENFSKQYLYLYKEISDFGYTKTEIENFLSLVIDDKMKKRRDSTITRANALYLWDECFIKNTPHKEESAPTSQSALFQIFVHDFPDQKDNIKSGRTNILRDLRSTSLCIEQGKFLPMKTVQKTGDTKQKISRSNKSGQPKPAATDNQ